MFLVRFRLRLAPAAAQGFVERDFVGALRQPGLGQRLFDTKERALGIKQVQAVGHAVAVAQIDEAVALAFGVGLLLLGLKLLGQRLAGGEGVGHFLEGGLDGFFVPGHGDVAGGLRRFHACAVAAYVEDG